MLSRIPRLFARLFERPASTVDPKDGSRCLVLLRGKGFEMLSDNGLALASNGLSPQSIEQMSRPMQRQAIRQVERIVTQGLATNSREQVRAMLTHTALQNVGALTALEEHLIKTCPLGAARYEAIVDAYALGAAQTIARW